MTSIPTHVPRPLAMADARTAAASQASHPVRRGGSTVEPIDLSRDRDPGTSMQIRVALLDDHDLVREALRMALERFGFVVVGEVAEPAELFDLLQERQCDVLLLDIGLGDSDGISTLRVIRARYPGVRVIMLSMHKGAETVRQALVAGADGYVVKGAHVAELTDAIRAVSRGERYLHSSVVRGVLEGSLRGASSVGPASSREREILRLLAAGYSTSNIADQLGISPHTVRRHIANLSSKLQVRGIPALVRYALRHGLDEDEDPG